MTPRFQINSNGSSPDSILRQFREVYSAAEKLRESLVAVRADALHGRNYQTLDNGETLAHEDREVVQDMIAEVQKFSDFAVEGGALVIRQRD